MARVNETAGTIFGDAEGLHNRRGEKTELEMREGLIARGQREGLSVDSENFPFRPNDNSAALREEVAVTVRRSEFEPELIRLNDALTSPDVGNDFSRLIQKVNVFVTNNFTTAERVALVAGGIDLSNPDSIWTAIRVANPTPEGFGRHRGAGYPDSPTPSLRVLGVFMRNLSRLLYCCVGGFEPDRAAFMEAIECLTSNLGEKVSE